jgi:hypothetical protein
MAAWLDTAQGSSGWTLTDTGRLEALVHWMSYPDTQYPALVCFAGNGNRVRALRACFLTTMSLAEVLPLLCGYT